MESENNVFIEYGNLVKFNYAILKKIGLDDYSTESVSLGLCETSLRGVDSHGVRLLPHYVDSAVSGRKNPKPNFQINATFPSIVHIDADNAFGHAAGMKAVDVGMDFAETQGVCMVSVSNSSHPGAMASMALKAARKGFACFAFTHADSLVLSHNGVRPYFGTNPICFAVPRKEREPYCLDMASSKIPWNRVLMHKNSNIPLAAGVAADINGDITTDPIDATSLLPTGSYKGFGLASMVEILCGIYSGMKFGREIPPMYNAPMDEPRHLGQLYIVMRVDGVIDADIFLQNMQKMTDQVRKEPTNGEESVVLPGDVEIDCAKERMEIGIPLDKTTFQEFLNLSDRYSVPIEFIK